MENWSVEVLKMSKEMRNNLETVARMRGETIQKAILNAVSFYIEANLNSFSDEESAFQDLCSTIIDKPSNSTIGFYIEKILQGSESEALTSDYMQHLQSFGLKIIKGNLFVATKNKNLFAACKDYPRLAKLLQKDDGLFLRKGTAKISGVSTKGIFVSLDKFNF